MNERRAYWYLADDVVFLNHGSFGACPKPVLQRQTELRELMERDPVHFFGHDAPFLLQQAREALGRFVNADPEELAFVPNVTTGLNAAIASLRLERDDELLITDHEYDATRNIVAEICARDGARLCIARVPFLCTSPDSVMEAVLAHVNSRTRCAVLDHVTSATGLIFPLERLIAELHSRGVRVIVDGAHAPGMLALDLSRIGADAYAGNCHKWLCAPKGAGFLHVPRRHQASIRPAVTSHGANARVPAKTRFRLAFDWTGTDDPTPALTVGAAIEFMESVFPGGWQAIQRYNRELALAARSLLIETLEVDCPVPDAMIGSLVAVPLPNSDRLPQAREVSAFNPDPLQMLLYERYRIQVPVTSCPANPRMIRISAAVYNDLGDYECLANALRDILGR